MTKEFKMTIEITVSGNAPHIAPHINDAIQELVNRRDFKVGTIRPGRVVQHDIDFGDVRVTVDLSTARIQPDG